MMNVTEQLARFAIETPEGFLSAQDIASVKVKFLDTLATTLAGSQTPAARAALALARELGGTARATILGAGDATSLPMAAFVNGISGHALEYDDNTTGAGHISVCLLPGCLAVAEHLDRPGRAMIEAFAMGFEIFCRIAWGLRPQLIDRGWHPQAVIGGQGVAVAACRLFGTDAMTARMAMGIVGSSATGLRKNVGSMGKAFHVGNGARAGVLAVLLARHGFQVDPDIIEGSDALPDGHERFGLADTYNGIGNYRLERMVDGLGAALEVGRNTTMVRLHPGSSAPAAAIDGMIELVKMHDLDPDAIASIVLECTPQCLAIAPYTEPVDTYKAKFCIAYTMAVACMDRKVGIEQYTEERIREPRVLDLMRRVTVTVPDDFSHHRGQWGENGVNWGEARVTVQLKNGETLRRACSHAIGWPERPATWEALCEKFEDCAAPVLSPTQIADAIAMIENLEHLPSVRDLTRALVTRPAS